MPGFLAEVLTWPTARWALPALKTARAWSTPPLTLLTGEASDWSDERNRVLAMALTLLESETCSSCGTPGWLGHSTNNEIAFSVKSSICYGCAELEQDRENRRHSRRGEMRYVVPHSVWEGGSLPSRHDCYQEE